jgi:AcrR family transcriptional regulator
MVRSTDAVKTTRAYNSAGRQERARQNRERVLRAAEQRFLRNGYAETAIGSIAAAADVSVDMIYKTFGGKPGLIRAIVERAIEGGRPVAAEQRSDRLQTEETDPRAIIEAWGRFVMELAPRGSPIVLLVRDAAATHPELRPLLDEIDQNRLRRMRVNARRLRAAGHLRPGISVNAAADVMWTYSAPELYELLVLRRGMSLQRFGRFVADAMTAALL